MGCWNKTCGLSNLHILHGMPVYVFVMERNQYTDERCYSTAFYRPLLLPFHSQYNDYGGGENSNGIGLPLILDGIKERLIEMEVGENEYHDIAVKRDAFGEKLFFDAVHENRLRINGYREPVEVDFVMFRADIVDDILKSWVQEKYVGDGKGDRGWGNNYIGYTFDDVLADLPEFMERVNAEMMGLMNCADGNEVLKALPPKARLLFCRGFEALFEWNHPNKASWYIHTEKYRYSQIVNVHREIINNMADGNVAQATALMIEYLKASYIDTFMHSVRKVWLPGAHEGSQSQERSGYLALNNAMARVLEEERKRYEDE